MKRHTGCCGKTDTSPCLYLSLRRSGQRSGLSRKRSVRHYLVCRPPFRVGQAGRVYGSGEGGEALEFKSTSCFAWDSCFPPDCKTRDTPAVSDHKKVASIHEHRAGHLRHRRGQGRSVAFSRGLGSGALFEAFIPALGFFPDPGSCPGRDAQASSRAGGGGIGGSRSWQGFCRLGFRNEPDRRFHCTVRQF